MASCLTEDSEVTYVSVWLFVYSLSTLVSFFGLMFFVSQGRRKRIGLYAALLVFGFCVIRTTEFALRVFDDHVYCPAGFQGTGYWVIAHLLFFLPQLLLIVLMSILLYTWYVLVDGLNTNTAASPLTWTRMRKYLLYFNIFLFVVVIVVLIGLSFASPDFRYAVNVTTNCALTLLNLVFLASFFYYGWNLMKAYRMYSRTWRTRAALSTYDSQLAKGHLLSNYGTMKPVTELESVSEFEEEVADDWNEDDPTNLAKAADHISLEFLPKPLALQARLTRILRYFLALAIITPSCLVVVTIIYLVDIGYLVKKHSYPGDGHAAGSETYVFTDPLPVLYLFHLAEIVPALSIHIALWCILFKHRLRGQRVN